jgi:hypothetical protein
VLIADDAGYNDPLIGQGLSIAPRDARTVCDFILDGAHKPSDFAPYGEERLGRMARLRLAADVLAAAGVVEDAPNRSARCALYGLGHRHHGSRDIPRDRCRVHWPGKCTRRARKPGDRRPRTQRRLDPSSGRDDTKEQQRLVCHASIDRPPENPRCGERHGRERTTPERSSVTGPHTGPDPTGPIPSRLSMPLSPASMIGWPIAPPRSPSLPETFGPAHGLPLSQPTKRDRRLAASSLRSPGARAVHVAWPMAARGRCV